MKKPDQHNPEFKNAWHLIGKSRSVFMTTHEGTDGDDLGSLLALRQVLLKMGKKVAVAAKKGVPQSIKFLPGTNHVGSDFAAGDYDLVVTFGCTKLERTNMPELGELQVPILNFDHHPDNSFFGTVNVVDPNTAAVAELIYYFLRSHKVEIDKNIGICLLTGIFTDTGGFKHANTSAEVLEVASELLKKGARIDRIAAFTYGQKRPQTLKAWSRGLENTRFDPKRQLVYSVMTEEDLKELGATEEDLQGFVEMLNHIPQAKFALLLRQDGDTVKGSMRSELHKGTDVSEIAHLFGGGGHKLAAGFTVSGKLVKEGKNWMIKAD
ncbi:MAG: DHH family phosphoesterase [Acidobacteriaceae bacterium]